MSSSSWRLPPPRAAITSSSSVVLVTVTMAVMHTSRRDDCCSSPKMPPCLSLRRPDPGEKDFWHPAPIAPEGARLRCLLRSRGHLGRDRRIRGRLSDRGSDSPRSYVRIRRTAAGRATGSYPADRRRRARRERHPGPRRAHRRDRPEAGLTPREAGACSRCSPGPFHARLHPRRAHHQPRDGGHPRQTHLRKTGRPLPPELIDLVRR